MNSLTLNGYVRQPRAVVAFVLVIALSLIGAIGSASVASAASGYEFKDVPSDAQFHTEVLWLAEQQITTGYSDGGFHPKESVSRQAFAAFLYRLAGKPAVSLPSRSPFKDVNKSDQFYKEIVWLSKKGITTGYADGTFKPGDKISREAIAAFLYRFEGRPSFTAPSKSPFKDMNTRSKFYKEVTWLSKSGMTTGYSDGTFRAKTNVSREAIAAFLYRGNTILEGDGTYQVGKAIKPGTYTAVGDEEDYHCYWERRSDGTDSDEGALAYVMVYTGTRTIITILESDKYFYTEGCSGWTPLRKTSPTATSFGDGSQIAGYHMRPGTYSAPGGVDCLWVKTSDYAFSDGSVIDYSNTGGKPAPQHLASGEGLSSWDCGTWKRTGN